MKLTCLGSWGAYPEPGSSTSSFLLEEDGFRLLIDCGSGVLSQLQQVIPIEQVDAVILSHYHHDHIADIGCLQYAMLINRRLGKRKDSLPIYGHGEVDNLLHSLTYQDHTVGYRILANQTLELGPWKVQFCPTIHSSYCLAMKFNSRDTSLVYTGDTGWSEQVVHFCKGADWVISEASLYQEQKGLIHGHLTSEEAGQLAQQAGVKHLVLTHFPHYGNLQQLLEEAQSSFSGEVELAREQKVWTLR